MGLFALGLTGCGPSPEEARAAKAAEIAQTTGRLIVKSNRPNVTVEARRLPTPGDASTATATGVIDQALSGLLPGKYAVVVRAEGWPDTADETTIEAGLTTELTLNFKTGSLRLESEPSGVTVKHGTTVLGKTPLVIAQLPPGDCRLALEYPTWPAVTFNTTITADVESTESVRLPHGKLIVESAPTGATVLLGKRTLGTTPLTMELFPAGKRSLTLQGNGFPPMEVSLTLQDRGEVKVSPELGAAFPQLDPAAILRNVWIPDNPDKLSPSFDEIGPLAPKNGIVKNLNRKKVHENWLRKKYRYTGVVKTFDRKEGILEFTEQRSEFSKYRVLARLTPDAADAEIFKGPMAKGMTLSVYGSLSGAEEARWPVKLITLELSVAEQLQVDQPGSP